MMKFTKNTQHGEIHKQFHNMLKDTIISYPKYAKFIIPLMAPLRIMMVSTYGLNLTKYYMFIFCFLAKKYLCLD